ncbi:MULTISPECIES: MarR family winged helix-turn-helix transcriptional regulator [Kitasatospora]|uniref:MarR family winged helix-turn-helix transcriptional regulator n=1 Tax=Kitasatospora TaxID=2063 RepID=UPI000C703F57|nr:MarR family transcriptional regulator [Kitasatospora sp. GP30]MDH6145234.1 DNA-binding MarR family transcriptional regulator [Kitasatospora sp. GP30]
MTEKQPPPAPLGLALRHAHLRAARIFAEELRPLELENVYAAVLINLGLLGSQTQRQLMDSVGSDKSAMVRYIDSLESRGLVRRRPHPTDRRAHAVELTDAGEAALAEVLTAASRTEERLLTCLEPGERRQFRELLGRFAFQAPERTCE